MSATVVQRERLSWRLATLALIVLAASYVVNAMDRQVFPVLVPTIDHQYGFSLQQGGLLATIFTLGIGVAGIPAGYLLDRMTRKSVIVIGILTYSVFTLLTVVSAGFGDMLVYRAGSGVGEALQNAALFSAVGAYFYKRRAMALGVLNFAYGTGGFLGPLLGAKMLVSSGWRTPFIVYGIIGLVFAVGIIFAISTRFTDQTEMKSELSVETPSSVPTRVWNRNIKLLVITSIVAGVSGYGYLGLYPTFLIKHLGYTPSMAGFCISMFGLGALMGIPAGFIGDVLRQKWILILTLICVMVVGYSLFNLIKAPGWQAFFSFLEGTFASGFMFTNTYSLMQRCVRPESVGRASGIFVTSWYLPSSVAGYLFAALVGSVGWGHAALVQLTVIPFIGILVLLFVKEDMILIPKANRVSNASTHPL
ncbi:MFS transporter [Alicyclobacillus mengziensis]|uniref:MFS transporter n=1 Tax=Alicyclobacillus mengziensis TaxID=2931921 RepID=A0A9X7Z9B5_9BACL|nr:MFS transporter [Alicyclobacillus mengziensis]QSO49321.1 MFS transporter [Alicyclobacillus mengziensis]